MQLFNELRRTSKDSFESNSDSKESWDVRLNSFKSGILRFFDSIDSIFISIRSILRLRVVVDRPGDASGGDSRACICPKWCPPFDPAPRGSPAKDIQIAFSGKNN